MNVGEAIAGCGLEGSEARMLLGATTGLTRTALIAHPESSLEPDAEAGFLALAARRRAGEPIAYLLGEREFYGIALRVTSDVLIPRPETELLVDFALERLPAGGTVLDLGTGSGAIALAIRHERPDARVTAVDRSEAALAVARANAAHLRLDVEFVQGSWFDTLSGRRFDLVLSNPPYIAEDDPHLSEGDVRFEPRGALVGGKDGLDAIRNIVATAPGHLRPGGWLAVEHGQWQDVAIRNLFEIAAFESVSSRPDLAGIARISIGKYNPE